MSKISDFQVIKKLGDGAFSEVLQVKRKSEGAQYAMKKVKMGQLTEKEKQSALNEVRILASIQHPNVIGYKDAFFENISGSLCIIMEMADNGDLLQMIEKYKKKDKKFTEKQVWHYFVQNVRGLKALHDLKIVHRDIKCANLFLTLDGHLKLGDLNVSKVAKQGLMHTQTGTPYYASPEVWNDKPYDNKSDIWSLGCVLYEMITLLPPFRASSMQALSQKVKRGVYQPIPSHFSEDLRKVVSWCLQVDPRKRPSCDQILASEGVFNNLTGNLGHIDRVDDGVSEVDSLLETIRCPRNLHQITDKLPKPQYQSLRRAQSMSLDISKNEINQYQAQSARNSNQVTSSTVNKSIESLKSNRDKRKGKRDARQLPIIQEDSVNEEYLDCSQLGLVSKRRDQKPNNIREERYSQVSIEQDHYMRLPVIDSRSDNYHHAKALEIKHSRTYENDDCTTEPTSSKHNSSSSRNAARHQGSIQNRYGHHDTRTPQQVSNKAMGLQLLPDISSKERLQSLDPPFERHGQYLQNSSAAKNGRNIGNVSLGVSSALGGSNNNQSGFQSQQHRRYESVGQHLRLARNESKERLLGYKDSQQSQHRGPRPNQYSGMSSVEASRYAEQMDSNLQAVYNQRKELLMLKNPGSLAARYHEQMQAREHRYHPIL